MKGRGSTFGAVSIVNAIAGGKGVTASIKLGTEATAELQNAPGAWKFVTNGKEVESKLAQETAMLALKMAGKDGTQYSGTVETTSVLPMGMGLKTSSSASSAIALAVFAALGQKAFDPRRSCSAALTHLSRAGPR